MQWHPLLAELLRPVLESFYEVQTNVPVGDVPREADIVLLRRITERPLPFHGIWTGLTTWNILEFKSPMVTPRVRDLDLLVEVGLGIDRRLNDERAKQQLRPLAAQQVSFWYLANRLSPAFRRQCQERLGPLTKVGVGVWRTQVIGRSIFLVSNVDLPVDAESLPLHIVSKGPPATELAVAQLVLEQPPLRRIYDQWLFALHKGAWKEVRAMSGVIEDEVEIDVKAFVEHFGMDRIIRQVGLKRVIDAVGVDRVIDEIGLGRVLDEIGPDRFLSNLTHAQRRELKRRLR